MAEVSPASRTLIHARARPMRILRTPRTTCFRRTPDRPHYCDQAWRFIRARQLGIVLYPLQSIQRERHSFHRSRNGRDRTALQSAQASVGPAFPIRFRRTHPGNLTGLESNRTATPVQSCGPAPRTAGASRRHYRSAQIVIVKPARYSPPSAAMALSSPSVLANSLRLRRFQ